MKVLKYIVPGRMKKIDRKKFNTATPKDHFPRKVPCLKFIANKQCHPPPTHHDPDKNVSNSPMDSNHAWASL